MSNCGLKLITVTLLVIVMLTVGNLGAAALVTGETSSPVIQNLSSRHYYQPADNNSTSRKTAIAEYPYSEDDIELLVSLVHSESEGESFTGKIAVAASLLNRVNDNNFPDTIPGVIYQVESGRYQYSPVLDGRINTVGGEEARDAVKAALEGIDPTDGATGFYNPSKTDNWWVRTRPVKAVIGNHVFFH